MARRIHIAIAEPSVIIRTGLTGILKRIANLNIDIAEITDTTTLQSKIKKLSPDILIIDPSCIGLMTPQQFKAQNEGCNFKIIALQTSLQSANSIKLYDEFITIYDTAEIIKDKLSNIINNEKVEEEKQELSAREKEIVVCIVKGMTNKEIADKLFLSTHTIMTHRRNIANKLKIHSPSGLTIYAIVNKLVDISDVK